MSGGDIFDRIKDRDQLSEEEVARYTKQVLEGLNYLHLRNYMHLDLKVSCTALEVITISREVIESY